EKLVEDLNIDGVEINYEQIDEADVENYAKFLTDLYDVLHAKGLAMDVVLEPYFPFDQPLPDGPTYTAMAYNVYGYHSGPGPKTTYDFLDELMANLELSNQDFNIALSTDGFTWDKEDNATAVSERFSQEMSESSTASEVKRDEASDALFFTYEEEGEERRLWYA